MIAFLDENGRFGFAWDIGYALWRENLHRGRHRLDIEDCLAIGERVLDHMRASGVQLSRKPSISPPHMPSTRREKSE
jgi:hypothetical protein